MAERDLQKPGVESGEDEITTPVFDPKTGEVTTKSVKDGVQALAICKKLRSDNEVRNWKNAMILAAYGGEQPYDQEARQQNGQAWMSNICAGHMEGVIGRSLPDHVELAGNVDRLGNLEAPDLPDHKRRIIRTEFIRQIKEWGLWPTIWELTMLYEKLFGWAVHIWLDEFNPWPTAYYNSTAHFPERTFCHPLKVKVFCVYDTMEVDDLWSKIKNAPKDKEDFHGWKVKNVRKALSSASSTRREENQWEEYEKDIRSGAIHTAICGSKVVEIFHEFHVEIDGTLTHYIVSSQAESSRDANKPDPTLFVKEGIKENMGFYLTRFSSEVGDGTWNGARGMGNRSMNAHRAKDGVYNDILDNVRLSGMILTKTGGEDQDMLMQFTVAMPFIFIPAEVQLQETPVPAVTEDALRALGMISGSNEDRTGDVGLSQSESRQVDITATEKGIDQTNRNKLIRTNLMRDVDPLAATLTNIFKRLAKKNSTNKFAVKFHERLTKKNITQEDLDKVDGVKSFSEASDAFGDTKQAVASVKNLFAGVGEVDWDAVHKDLMTCLVGAERASRYLPLPFDHAQKIEAERLQKLELTTIEDNVPVDVSPRDLHQFHAPLVDGWFQARIKQAGEGRAHQELSPTTLALGLKHFDSHLKYLEADKLTKEFASQLRENYKRYEAIVNKLHVAEEEAIRQQQQNPLAGIPGQPGQTPAAGGAPAIPESSSTARPPLEPGPGTAAQPAGRTF